MNVYLDIFRPSYYFLNPYFIPPFLVACLVLSFGFFVLSLEKRSAFNRSFFYLCISASVWLLSQCLILSGKFSHISLFWSRIMYAGLFFTAAAIFHISITYTDRYDWEKRYVVITYIIAGVFSLALWSNVCCSGVREHTFGFYPDAGILFSPFLLFLLFCPILGLVNLASFYKIATIKLTKKRTKHLMIAFVFVSLSNIDILPSYGIAIYPFGYVAVLCFILSVAYSIIKYHNLMAQRYSEELKEEVDKKTEQISNIVEQLKATQVKLFETGKVSAMASLSAGILHQISQPITAIHGFVKFMKKEMKDEDPFLRPVKLMDEQVAYLKDMLEDLMELIRHRKIKKENIDVNLCLKKAVELLTDELRIRRTEFQVTLADELPQVFADAIHLQQIFMNIIVNAIQALSSLPKGSKRRLLIVSRFDDVSNKVMITFRNTGPGLTEEDCRNIFEPFFSTKTKGSGIGLALCKDLIAEHGGTIEATSEPQGGATFTVKLPPVSA